MRIEAIIFDADGVLFIPHQFADYLQRQHALSRETMREFFDGVFQKCLVNQADVKQELPPFLSKWGWPGTVDDFLHRWFTKESQLDARVVSRINKLRNDGLLCCLGSNQERRRMSYLENQLGIGQLFDKTFYSAAIGFKKPQPEFYKHIENALQLAPEELLFWDDRQENVEGARHCGWHAEKYESFAKLKNKTEQSLKK